MKNFLKITATYCLIVFAVYGVMELACFMYLSSVTPVSLTEWGIDEQLTKKFPAQLRMSREEILQEFPRISVMERTGQFLTFDFDPSLGFRRLDYLRWYNGSPADVQDKFLIVTFGGSTTQLNSWPLYLPEAAHKKKVAQEIVVLNAGLAGYMTFNEKNFFSSWIMPMLEQLGKKPDLILTLDGVNDIWYRIFSYYEAPRAPASPWYYQYHAVHQKLDTDMQAYGTVDGATRQLLATVLNKAKTEAQVMMPYTMRTIVYIMRRRMVAGGRHNSSAAKHKPGIESLPEEAMGKIIQGYHDSLLDFYGMASARGIRFVAYQQPVVLKNYYPFPMPDSFPFKSINEMGVMEHQANGSFTRLPVNRIIDTEPLYIKAEAMYEVLNKQHPGSFTSLIRVFSSINRPEELFKKDAIHYEILGKKVLAQAMIDDLLQKGILTLSSTSTHQLR